MKKLAFAAIAAVALFASGCIAQAPNSNASAPPTDVRVTVAPELWGRVQVTDVCCTQGESSFLNFQANVVNNTHGVVRMEYRVDWLDATGSAIPSVVSTWQPISAAAREVVPLQATAPSPDAVDFRFYVQAERR